MHGILEVAVAHLVLRCRGLAQLEGLRKGPRLQGIIQGRVQQAQLEQQLGALLRLYAYCPCKSNLQVMRTCTDLRPSQHSRHHAVAVRTGRWERGGGMGGKGGSQGE